ncbi:MAG TPA: HPF/RaiA family ribosome-associated protein [Candidatus Paceibacterota bacterium]|nr:HPF/RaiA family ribosome-associated protein [Candidatus Paceibacterota bacterium]
MNVQIKTTDYELTPQLSSYLDEKIEALEKLISDDAARCEIEIGRAAGHPQQGRIWKAEIVITHFGERHRAFAQEESVNAAIDIAKDEMQQLLRKSKGRQMTLARRMGARLKRWARWGIRK